MTTAVDSTPSGPNRRFSRGTKRKIVTAAVILVLIVLLIWAFAQFNVFGGDHKSSANSTTTSATATSTPPTSSAAPSSSAIASASPTSSATAPNGSKIKKGTTTGAGATGQLVTLPYISGNTVNNGDTTHDPTVPGLNSLLPKSCGTLVNWGSLVHCVNVNHATWYIDGLNRMTPYTGFKWSDVLRWAKAKTVHGATPEVREIFLTGSKTKLSDAQARAAVVPLVSKAVASNLKVIRYTGQAFLNTWRTNGSAPSMTQFLDYGDEVRVSLVPEVLNSRGQVIGINSDRQLDGVFIDCKNVHGVMIYVPPVPTKPVLCPPGTSKAGQTMPQGGVTDCTPPKKVTGCTSGCSTTVVYCTSGPWKGIPVSVHGYCAVGKHASEAPSPTGGTVKLCPGGYLDRKTNNCVYHSYAPSATPSATPSAVPTPTHSGSGPTIAPPTTKAAPPSSTVTHTAKPTPPPPPGS